MVTTSSRCCCCSLRTGTLVVGWLEVIGSVLSCVTLVVQLLQLDQLGQMMGSSCSKQQECMNKVYSVAIGCYSVCLIMNMISVIVSILLIYAVHISNPGFTTPFVVYITVITVLMLLAAIVIIAVLSAAGTFFMPAIFLNIYYIYVVLLYRAELMMNQVVSVPMQEKGLEADLGKQ